MQVIPSLEIRFNWYNCRALNINILSFRRALFNQAISKKSVCLFLSVLLYKYTPTMSQKKKKQRWIIALLLLHSHPSSLLCKTSAFLKLCHISQDKASQLFFLLASSTLCLCGWGVRRVACAERREWHAEQWPQRELSGHRFPVCIMQRLTRSLAEAREGANARLSRSSAELQGGEVPGDKPRYHSALRQAHTHRYTVHVNTCMLRQNREAKG